MPTGVLYLVPVPIADDALHTLPAEIYTATERLEYYVAENARTARRLIKKMHPQKNIEPLQFSEIDKHTGPDRQLLKDWLKSGKEVGLMSEAGCPAVADPGNELVGIAHSMGARVVPLTGPSSLLLALIGSGLEGQRFAFNGYLPVKDPQRRDAIKSYEIRSSKEKETELFIETPYRNEAMLKDLLQHCRESTRLCIAQNLSAPSAHIKTATIGEWKKMKVVLEKVPTVFLILAQ